MEDIERGKVGRILIKDMSRLGCDHLRVGLFFARGFPARPAEMDAHLVGLGANPLYDVQRLVGAFRRSAGYDPRFDG